MRTAHPPDAGQPASPGVVSLTMCDLVHDHLVPSVVKPRFQVALAP
jgi:hypothetical protein